MQVTPELLEDILLEYKRTRSPYKIAKALGIDTRVVWEVLEEHSDRLTTRIERFGGFGRPEMQQFMVARRMVSTREWDNQSPEIAVARQRYEAGTHNMMTGRDGGWLILYSQPNKRKVPRPNYFRPEYI